MSDETTASSGPRLKRSLTLWNLIIIGIVIIQPIAPMGIYGVVNNAARDDRHAVESVTPFCSRPVATSIAVTSVMATDRLRPLLVGSEDLV